LKYLIIAALLASVGLLIYWRLRPYLNVVRRVFSLFHEARRLTRPDDTAATPAPRSATHANERLTRCASCGTWLPASRALVLRSSPATYCSHACLERSAGNERKTRVGRQ